MLFPPLSCEFTLRVEVHVIFLLYRWSDCILAVTDDRFITKSTRSSLHIHVSSPKPLDTHPPHRTHSQDEILRLQAAATALTAQNESLQSQMETQIGALLRRLDQPAVVQQLTASSSSSNNNTNTSNPYQTGTATGTPNANSDDVREMQHHLDLLLTESDLMREQEAVFRAGALRCAHRD